MAEINNGIPKFGYNIEKIDNKKNIIEKPSTGATPEVEEQQYVPDTGVLGRSQIKNTKGADVTKSVDDAVLMAEKYPEILECGDDLFDILYEQFIADGMDETDAYAAASEAITDEFKAISIAHSA